ncbi:hypothetical protein A3Q37_03158 [Streptomyces sp. PTY087I2]|nr:hypothetical protein A3Q37_03158 [Streptomyces sp. PTY087I2]
MTLHKAPAVEDAYVPSERRIARERYRRGRTRRATAIAATSTLVVGAVLFVLITNSPGWTRTKETFFSAHYARVAFPQVLEGLWLNLRLLAVCGAAVLVLGLLLAVARTLRARCSSPCVRWPPRTRTSSGGCRSSSVC